MTAEKRMNENMGILRRLSRLSYARMQKFGSTLEFEDLLQEAGIAFMRADETFDPDKGVKFSTYLWRVVERSLRRVEGSELDSIRGCTSMDAPVGDGESEITLHDALSDQSGEHADDRLVKIETMRSNMAKLSKDSAKAVMILNSPPTHVVREVERLKAFRLICKSSGYAAGNVKLDIGLACELLGYDKGRITAVRNEINGLLREIC